MRTVSSGPPAGGAVPSMPYVYPLTVALLPLTWRTVRRIQAARPESREGFFDGLS